MDCGVAAVRCCTEIRDARCAGTERIPLVAVRELLIDEEDVKRRAALLLVVLLLLDTLVMVARAVEGAVDPTSAGVCTTMRSEGNNVARVIAIDVECAPT